MGKHLAIYGPPISQNKLWLPNVVINLLSLCLELIWHPSIAFHTGLWNILSESIDKMLWGGHPKMCEAKPSWKVADVVRREPRWKEFVPLCPDLVVVPIINEVV